jgi:nucleoside-diphosphate-sugar epimerase
MKAIVTGGAGFVGRHLTKGLLDRGWEVLCLDSIFPGSGAIDPRTSNWYFNPFKYTNYRFTKVDCRIFFEENREDFDAIFHLAAVVGGRATIDLNPLAVAQDLSIDAEMWGWAARLKTARVVNFSSSAAYPTNLQIGEQVSIKLREDMIQFGEVIGSPDMTYGWAKLTSEYLGHIAFKNYGIKNMSYRPFSGYGPDQDIAYPFPSICKRAVEHHPSNPFVVWGSGKQVRDFIHIDDCVEGILNTMFAIDNGEALNLSTGVGTSFLEFAKTALRILGKECEVVGDLEKPTGVQNRIGDTTKQANLGFTNKRLFTTGIVEGVNYWEHLKDDGRY